MSAARSGVDAREGARALATLLMAKVCDDRTVDDLIGPIQRYAESYAATQNAVVLAEIASLRLVLASLRMTQPASAPPSASSEIIRAVDAEREVREALRSLVRAVRAEGVRAFGYSPALAGALDYAEETERRAALRARATTTEDQ